MNILQRFKRFFTTALLLLSTTGAAGGVTPADGLLEAIQKRGELRVGMSTFVPWAMRNKEGKLIGFEIDVATKVARDMGVDVKFVPTAWNEIIPALLAGQFDVIIGGMTITPQRNLAVNFTIPYAHSGSQLAAGKKLAGGFSSKQDFNSPDVIITCHRGSTPCKTARDRFPRATIRPVDDDALAFREVANGNAHGMISSAPVPLFWSETHADQVFMPFGDEIFAGGDDAFALRKGDVDSLNFFSNWIRINTGNGWLTETHDYWFKSQTAWKDRVAPNQ